MNFDNDRTVPRTIAVDFDGTLCEYAWPNIGAEKENVTAYVRKKKKRRLDGNFVDESDRQTFGRGR